MQLNTRYMLAAILLVAVSGTVAALILPPLVLLTVAVLLALFLVGLLSAEFALFLVVLAIMVDTSAVLYLPFNKRVADVRYTPYILPLFLAVPGWFASRASNRLPRRTPTSLDGLLLLMVAYELLSIFWGPPQYSSFWSLSIIANILLYFFVTAMVRDGRTLKRIALFWIVAGSICAIGVMASRFVEANTSVALTERLSLEFQFGIMGNRPSGFAGHNHAAGYCAMAMVLAVGMALEQQKFGRKLLYFGQALLMLSAVIMTESRGAMIGSVVAGVFYCFMHPQLKHSALKWSIVCVTIVMIVTLVVRPGMLDRLLIGFGYTGKLYFSHDNFFTSMEGSEVGLSGSANRLVWWINGLKEMAEHPWKLILGLGLGGFAYYSQGSPDTNSIYAWFFYDMGLFGIIIFFIFWAVFMKTISYTIASGKTTASYNLFLASLTAFLLEPGIHGLIELDWSLVGSRLVWFPLALLMAAVNVVLAETTTQARKEIEREAIRNSHLPSLVRVCLAILTVLLIWSVPACAKESEHTEHNQMLKLNIGTLLMQEQKSPTLPTNVGERHRQLVKILDSLIRADQSGIRVDRIFSVEDEKHVQALFAEGQSSQAAELIHKAILKLEGIKPPPQHDWHPEVASAEPKIDPPAQIKPIAVFDIHRTINANSHQNILKLMNAVIEPANRRLYFSGGKSNAIGVIDLNTDKIIRTFDIGRPGGFLIRDPRDTGKLYLFDISKKRFFQIDIHDGNCTPIFSLPSHVKMPPRDGPPLSYQGITYYPAAGYPFSAGSQQEENGSYTILEGLNTFGKRVCRLRYGPDALYDVFDTTTGKLYAMITGGGSIDVFDLNQAAKRIKSIDVGTSIDQIVLNSDTGDLFIRNRLGGSSVHLYELPSGKIHTLNNENEVGTEGIGMWPTEMIYDDGKLYVLSHYGGRVDIVDATTMKLLSKINLAFSFKPRTDMLSTMTLDRTRKFLYVGSPELGEITAIDLANATSLQTIKIKMFDTNKDGPAQISMAVDEKRGNLLTYFPIERRLDLYAGGTLDLINSTQINAGRYERMLTVHPHEDLVYIGNQVMSLPTLKVISQFPFGDRVIGLDHTTGRVYLTSCERTDQDRKVETVYTFEKGVLKQRFKLMPIIDIPSSFAFDFTRSKCFVGYMESAQIAAYDLLDPSMIP